MRPRASSSAGAVQEPPVAIDELAVGVDLAAGAQVADQIPVERGAVEPSGLRIRRAEREVDGAADLLVEEDVTGEDPDRLVEAEGEPAAPARAVVDADHLAQEGLPAARSGVDNLSGLEAKTHVVDLACVEDRGVGERDLALDAGFERCREDLAVGQVLLPLGRDPRAVLDRHSQIGPLCDDPELTLGAEEIGEPHEAVAELPPAG